MNAHPLLTQWATARSVTGTGRRAIVVGCGLGADAEYIAGLGFDTTGFDISPTAIELARGRFPNSGVWYVAADLLDPPDDWLRAFDLVVEVITVQALPEPARRQAIVNVGRLVAPAGTLVVVAAARDDGEEASDPPPWPLRRGEVEAFTADGLATIRIEDLDMPGQPGERRWRAEFVRKA